jgi:hypothetical protein
LLPSTTYHGPAPRTHATPLGEKHICQPWLKAASVLLHTCRNCNGGKQLWTSAKGQFLYPKSMIPQ